MDWSAAARIGSDDCYVQNYDDLCFSAKPTETILCNNNLPDNLPDEASPGETGLAS